MARTWIFTFGSGQKYGGHYVKITAESYGAARKEMVKQYGLDWAFQYSEEDWNMSLKEKRFPHETELEENS